MAVLPKPDKKKLFVTGAEKEAFRKLAREVNERIEITYPPAMTIEELYASQVAHGIRPEDNGASRELMRMRYGDDYKEDDEQE